MLIETMPNKSQHKSRMGFPIYTNMDLIQWISKKQLNIETSVFGAEFVAINHRMETLRGLQYKLRMMGVTIYGPSYIYGDNIPVIYNTQCTDSTLRQKSNWICYHAMRESVTMVESLMTHILKNYNPLNVMNKVLAFQKR